jgi:serine beta-lactamase-like protein LACTB
MQHIYQTSNLTCQRLCVNHQRLSFHSESKSGRRQEWHNYQFYVPVVIISGIIGGYVILGHRHREEVECEAEVQRTRPVTESSEQESSVTHQTIALDRAINEADELIQRIKLEKGCPGVVVAVTVDGKEIWSKGYGLSDVENLVECKPASVMRIASISKPLTMVAIARLWEQGKLDLDKSIQHYVSSWPDKTFKGQKVTITTRQLVSMMGGVRHYDKTCKKEKDEKSHKENKAKKAKEHKDKQKESKKPVSEFDQEEYYLRKHFPDVSTALELFKNDELCSLPGTEFRYSTHAWTLLSAVIEGASGRCFTDTMKDIFRDLGLEHTYLDEDAPIIPNRARYYVYDKKRHCLVNAPYVDNSYKWAGGGFLSTVHDLCHFGNAMLHSYQFSSSNCQSTSTLAGYLRSETVAMIWSPVDGTKCSWDKDGSYGMGWGTIPAANHPGFTREQRMYVSHTGGAVGASSVLLILPRLCNMVVDAPPPRGVCVAIIVNTQSVGLNKTALKIAQLFDSVEI